GAIGGELRDEAVVVFLERRAVDVGDEIPILRLVVKHAFGRGEPLVANDGLGRGRLGCRRAVFGRRRFGWWRRRGFDGRRRDLGDGRRGRFGRRLVTRAGR